MKRHYLTVIIQPLFFKDLKGSYHSREHNLLVNTTSVLCRKFSGISAPWRIIYFINNCMSIIC